MKMSWSSPYILGGVWRLVRLIAPAGLEAKVEVMCSAVKLVRALLLKEPVVSWSSPYILGGAIAIAKACNLLLLLLPFLLQV